MKSRLFIGILCAVLIALTFFSYHSALDGPFVFDDQVNIQENPAVAIRDLSITSLKQAMFSNQSGELKRLLPALSFGLNHYQAQGFMNTFVFKLTNLIIHILNGLLVFGLASQLAPRIFPAIDQGLSINKQYSIFAFFVALLWLVHPLQVTTVAYIVQRMTSMATLFMLLGLNGYVYARERLERKPILGLLGMFLAIVLGTLLGLLAKENAVLLILYTGVIELCWYPKQAARNKILWGYAAILGIGLCAILYLNLTGRLNILEGYYSRPFTLEQRLLTEARVLWFYLQMLVVPHLQVMGLYHDDLALSKSWLEPFTTVVSVILWAVTLLVAWLLRNKQPVLTFAVLWFLVGHSMESSILPLEIIFEHRNYLPSLSIIILIVYGLALFGRWLGKRLEKWQGRNLQMPSIIALCSVISLIYVGLTSVRANYWASEETLFQSMAQHHPESPISLYTYAELLNKKQDRSDDAYPYYLKAVSLNPNSASLIMQTKLSTPISAPADPLLDSRKLLALLSQQRLKPLDISVLNDAAHCALGMNIRCAQHQTEIRQWLHAAIDNRYLDQDWRRDFVKSLFEIEMAFGAPEDALATVTKAQAQDDRVFQYYLMKADALSALGKHQEALLGVETAEQLAQRFNPALLPVVQRMKDKVTLRQQH